jgi:hypothetical protein
MAKPQSAGLTLFQSSALALAEAANGLDTADNAQQFVSALETNRRVWQAVRDLAEHYAWPVPERGVADFAIESSPSAGRIDDQRVSALIDLNRRISAELVYGSDLASIRERACFLWDSGGRPQGQDMEHWLIAEMEISSHGH